MNGIRQEVTDLGIAAYLRMHGFKVVGRNRSKNIFYFEVNPSDGDNFNRTIFEYANSESVEFDKALMVLKQMPHFVPPLAGD